jgi:hypothetical protein
MPDKEYVFNILNEIGAHGTLRAGFKPMMAGS